MPFDPNAADVTVGVVGTGAMARGIMQVAAQGSLRVVAYDEMAGAAEAARPASPGRSTGSCRRAACRRTRPRAHSTASPSP